MRTGFSRLRALLQPGIVIPLLLSAALLALASSLGDLGTVVGRVRTIPIHALVLTLLLAVAYLTIKCWQLHVLLRRVNLHPGWQRLLLAFAVGELSLTLPLGIFAQNWVLSATARGQPQFGRSSSATVVMLILETMVVFLVLAVIGIPNWPQLQPIAALCAFGLLACSYLALRYGHLAEHLPRRARHKSVRHALQQLHDLVQGLQHIYRPRLLFGTLLASVAYLCALAVAFMIVGRHMGIPQLSLPAAVTIYAFSLAVVLMFGGLLSQIGLVEVLGMSAAQAWGLSLTDGLALMLGFRLVWTGAMWLLNLPLVIALWYRL